MLRLLRLVMQDLSFVPGFTNNFIFPRWMFTKYIISSTQWILVPSIVPRFQLIFTSESERSSSNSFTRRLRITQISRVRSVFSRGSRPSRRITMTSNIFQSSSRLSGTCLESKSLIAWLWSIMIQEKWFFLCPTSQKNTSCGWSSRKSKTSRVNIISMRSNSPKRSRSTCRLKSPARFICSLESTQILGWSQASPVKIFLRVSQSIGRFFGLWFRIWEQSRVLKRSSSSDLSARWPRRRLSHQLDQLNQVLFNFNSTQSSSFSIPSRQALFSWDSTRFVPVGRTVLLSTTSKTTNWLNPTKWFCSTWEAGGTVISLIRPWPSPSQASSTTSRKPSILLF